jgi:thiamine-monophosphate kinase
MVREIDLIERVHRKFPSGGVGLSIGIGDDAAVLRPGAGKECVITTDAFLENVHFLRSIHAPRAAGYKALARATSDIAAMGARARYFFLTMGIPDSCTGPWLDDFLDGMAGAARQFGLILAGGDTTKYPVVVASLTVLGEVDRGRAILRSGAKPGDLLCVSGRLGEAELGLRMIQRKLHRQKRWTRLMKKHFQPEPRLALGEWLAAHRCATSMIDTSDGLSTDLAHICKASGVGAVVWAQKIPMVRIPPEIHRLGLDPLELALHGGEDYELLFTVPKKFSGRLPRKVKGVSVTVIGEITRAKNIVLLGSDGNSVSLQTKGWDPFCKKD